MTWACNMEQGLPSVNRRLLIRRGVEADLPGVVRIERASFPLPWSEWALRAELNDARRHLYLVAIAGSEVIGFTGGQWFLDTCHVSTLAVAEAYRQQGIGEALLLTMLLHLADTGITQVYLEYRASNRAAARLYEKVGFRRLRIRVGYYRDSNEDAFEMGMDDLGSVERQAELRALWAAWRERWRYNVEIVL